MTIENPLLVPQGGPEIACPTGWHTLAVPDAPYHGHEKLALAGSGVVRLYAPPGGDTSMCARLWHPHGIVAGLYTDQGRHKHMVGSSGRRGKVMADPAGVEFLRGRLPWSRDPVRIPEGSPWIRLGVQYYPFSSLSHVLVTSGGPLQLLEAVVRSCAPPVVRAHGGVPVLCLPELPDRSGVDYAAIGKIRWPANVTILAATEQLADIVSSRIFVDVREWTF